MSRFEIGLVARCGWVLAADLAVGGSASAAPPTLSVRIVHRTPRVQVLNSAHERVPLIGGMALCSSLPDDPVPLAAAPCGPHGPRRLVWLGDVREKRYIMPAKDKYVLCEELGTASTSGEREASAPGMFSVSSQAADKTAFELTSSG